MMLSWKTAFITLVIFACGAASGTFVTARVMKEQIEGRRRVVAKPTVGPPEAPPRNQWQVRARDSIARVVKATPEQKAKIEEILRETHQANRKLRDDIQAVAAKADTDIIALLQPEQKEDYQRYMARRKAQAAHNQANQKRSGGQP
jgi:Spy/CpxP family protein refolding chaperone